MGRIKNARKAFSDIYDRNTWGKGSGVGSMPEYTAEYATFLAEFLRANEIRSVVDFGCGDWQFSRFVEWEGIEYDGFDVVQSVIDANTAKFGSDRIRFHLLTDGVRLPPADLLVCKDVLQHLPTEDVLHYLDVFKTLYKTLLITNDVYPEAGTNADIAPGQWRPLRPDLAPFKETSTVVLQWDVIAYGNHWKKQTHRIVGMPTATAAEGLRLRDNRVSLGSRVRTAARAVKDVIRPIVAKVPPLYRLLRKVRDAFNA